MSWRDKTVTMVTWPTVVGIMLIIVMASLSRWLVVEKETNERLRYES